MHLTVIKLPESVDVQYYKTIVLIVAMAIVIFGHYPSPNLHVSNCNLHITEYSKFNLINIPIAV